MARMRRSHVEALEKRVLLAVATVNWNDVRQSIDGFGASSAWMWSNIPSTALDQIYSTSSGAGLSLLRSRIAPNGWSSESNIMQQVGSYGVHVWSTPWAPPREWKTNHDEANGGSLDPAHYQDYANLLADYVQDEARQGVPLYAISLQNEPNWVADYESCIWSAQQFADFLPYVGQTFASRGITTKIMLPETLNWSGIASYASIVMANPSLAQYVGILAGHNYSETTGSYQPVSNANGKPVWETEVYSSVSGTELATAIDMADDIHQAMSDANASAYHYWWLNSSSAAGGLMNGWTATKRLWAMGQYSRFVRPGWVRIGETDDGGLDITTFKDPVSGKFAIVVVNTGTSSVTESFTLSGVSAGSVTPYITSGTDNLTQYSAIALTGGTSFSATIAASSVVTYYGISSSALTLQAPGNPMAAPVQGYTTSRIALSWSDNSSSETAYTVERSTDGTNWSVLTTTLAANTTSYVDTGRAENTRYYYRIKPTNGDATTYSTVVSASTVLQVPGSASGIRTSSGVNLSWTINSVVSTGASIDRSLDGLTWTNIVNLTTRATSYSDTIPSYNANQVYYYRVRNTAGSTYSAYTAWNTGLATPASFASGRVTSSSITFTWTSPTIGATGAWIEQYNASTSSWSVVSPSSLQATDGTWTLTGLSGNTSYTFRMRVSSAADSVYSPYTSSLGVTTALQAVWYKADESSGSTLTDASGSGNNASLIGSYSFAAGVSGNALSLSGGYASLPTGIASGLSTFTIATWVKFTSIGSWSRLFDFGTGTSVYLFLTPKSSSGYPRFAITIGGGSGEQQINCTTALSTGVWTHFAVTLAANASGNSYTGTLYLNGVAVGSNSNMTLTPASLGNTTKNYLGKSQFSADPALQGSLDDFRIYTRALSAAEVLALSTPTVVNAATASPTTVTGTSTTLRVLGTDVTGGEAGLSYTWALTSGPAAVTFSANGTNAAKNTTATFSQAGSYTFTVTLSNGGGKSTTSAVGVTVNQTLTSIALSPRNLGLAQGGTQQFTATGSDQFGTAMSTQPSFTWSATGGAISSNGLLTTGTAAGSYQITASSGSISGSVSYSVWPAAPAPVRLQVQDGSLQRSMVTSLTLTFDQPVSLAPGAISLTPRGSTSAFITTLTNPSGDGKTYVLSFSGSVIIGSSLPDGIYDLSLMALLVQDAYGQTLGGGDRRYTFHRLYGDANGDGSVNSIDNFQLRQTFGLNSGSSGYLWYFDYDNDGSVNSLDNFQFRARFGLTYSY